MSGAVATPRDYGDRLLNLDGEPTRTAGAHAADWKRAADIAMQQDEAGDIS